MADLEKDFEVGFKARRAISERDIQSLVRYASSIGFSLTTHVREPILPETYESMARKSPIISGDSFAGREHFITYGEKVGAKLITVVKLFGILLHPNRERWPRAHDLELESSLREKGIIVAPRAQVGLGLLPTHLMMATDVNSKVDPPANYEAIRASSVIMLSEYPDMLEGVEWLGPRYLEALGNIAGQMRQDITIHETATKV